ncbi:MAG: PEGA domain-containing protein [Pseudomonadota bacterium]|jgi:hypothetical protein
MHKKTITVLAIASTILLNSCATILSGTSDVIVIKTKPVDAKIEIDDQPAGTSNNAITVKRQFADYREVRLKAEGYETQEFKIRQKIDGKYWLGILGAGIPMIIDIITGAALKPVDLNYEKELEKKN